MSGVKSLKKVDSDAPELNKVQEYTQQALAPVKNAVIIDGTLLSKVKLVAGKDNDIDHKLDRNLRGWILVRQRAEAKIWDLQDSNKLSKKTLRLWTDADVTVDLWVF